MFVYMYFMKVFLSKVRCTTFSPANFNSKTSKLHLKQKIQVKIDQTRRK